MCLNFIGIAFISLVKYKTVFLQGVWDFSMHNCFQTWVLLGNHLNALDLCWKSPRLRSYICFSFVACVIDLPTLYKSCHEATSWKLRMFRLEYFYFHLQPVFQPMLRLLQLSECKCVNLGSVLQLLQLQWSKQCPPGQQRHRWDREVVAEPTPLQGIGLQRGECHPGPRSGEMIVFFSATNCWLTA